MMNYDNIGIYFNNKHTLKDLGMKMINSKENEIPQKSKILETVPGMHGSYDFSSLYGGAIFSGDRELTYTFLIENENIQTLQYRKIMIDNWIMTTNEKSKLIDDTLEGFYYMAECVNVDYENYYTFGIVQFTFNAYPFKISDKEEGNVAWDTFNFELDVLQDTKFEVTGSKDIMLYNLGGKEVVPVIICSDNMDVIKNNVTYKLEAGESKDYRFLLNIGENKLTIKGAGTIEFKFRKELL